MMYKFPYIEHINDVLPAIEGRNEFIVADRGSYKIINYNVMFSDTFPNLDEQFATIRRDCRGIIFDSETGIIIRRPLHKFFNINERDETLSSHLDFSKPHKIYDKIDGSMISPLMIGNEIIWGTKMAAPDFHEAVSKYVESKPNYTSFARHCIINSYTPIFEWTSPQNRIVINHKEENLTLLAIRDMASGEYVEDILSYSNLYNIPIVKSYDSVTDIDKFIEDTSKLEDCEGFVVSWDDGYKVKIKCDWYLQIHRAKEKILRERHVLAMILDNQLDDVLSFLPEEDKANLTRYQDEFLKAFSDWVVLIYHSYLDIKEEYRDDKKEFALGKAQTMEPTQKSIIFKLWDKQNIEFPIENFYEIDRICIEIIKKKLGSTKNFEEIKQIAFPNIVYGDKDMTE